MITAEQFERMTPFQKGYTVYMAGERDDEPNVPAVYHPHECQKSDYERGQLTAIIEVQDSP